MINKNFLKYIFPCFVLLVLFQACGTLPQKKYVKVKAPENYIVPAAKKKIIFYGDAAVVLYSRNFAQGEAVYMELYTEDDIDHNCPVSCTFDSRKVYLTRMKWGHRGFFALPPDRRPGRKYLKVIFESEEKTFENNFYFNVKRTKFPVYSRKLRLGKFSNEDYKNRPDVVAFIIECSKKKQKAFNAFGKDRMGKVFSHPRDVHYITSPFWSTRRYESFRVINGKKIPLKPKINIHRGLDFRGEEGEPVFALADGRVILAEKMFYEGNFTIIDHGKKVFSYYMHQVSISVKPGQVVSGGDIIGYVGSTGISTGAHLHVSLIINGIQADPLSLLSLPVRE